MFVSVQTVIEKKKKKKKKKKKNVWNESVGVRVVTNVALV